MKLLKKILTKLNGLHYSQEYLCIADGSFQQPLHVYLVDKNRVVKDITNLHAFVGYCPLIFAITSDNVYSETVNIAFSTKTLLSNEILSAKDAIAFLTMKKIPGFSATGDNIQFFEGAKGSHHFISRFHQNIIQLNNRLYHKKPGNVFLAGNLYKQVQIAYSTPRNISLITVGSNERFNLFPTDLHGPLDETKYLISLRHEGKACRQVTILQKLLLTQVESTFYKTVYALGKNHMQELKHRNNFPFSADSSANFQLPIPESAILYRELELQDSFIHGIHRIMLFKTLSQQGMQSNEPSLAHIHNVYATWRHKQGLTGNYLLR
ncbi:MAG TPA: hypothetical protein VF476_00150 [Chitinophagaceae bacterium]